MAAENPAESYELFAVPKLFAPSARRLVALVEPQSGERALDVGCGTGIVSRLVAPCIGPSGTMTGIDLNPAMLDVARRVAAQEGLTIDFREGRAEALPFADGSFDLVLCQYALMFFADRAAALAEMRRVLDHGGRAGLSVWQGIERHPFYQELDGAIERRLGESSVGDIFALGDLDALRDLLGGAGFTEVRFEPFSFTACFPDPEAFLAGEIDLDTAAIPAMQHLDAGARRDLVASIRGDMDAALREHTHDGELRLPFHATIARARR
jgi:SAM-dependent methyltransferase